MHMHCVSYREGRVHTRGPLTHQSINLLLQGDLFATRLEQVICVRISLECPIFGLFLSPGTAHRTSG